MTVYYTDADMTYRWMTNDHYAPSVCVKLMVNTWPQVNPGSTQGLKLMGSCHRCSECSYDNWRPWEQASGVRVQSVYMITGDYGSRPQVFRVFI